MKMKIDCGYEEIGQLELEYYEKPDRNNPDKPLKIIAHNTLEKVVFVDLQKLGIRQDYKFPKTERKSYFAGENNHFCYYGHSVVTCTITDNNGRYVSEVGEYVERFDDDNACLGHEEIIRQIPVTTAKNRAFDRAVIRYLGIPGRVYSDSEFLEMRNIEKPVMNNVKEDIPDSFDTTGLANELTDNSVEKSLINSADDETGKDVNEMPSIPDFDDISQNDTNKKESDKQISLREKIEEVGNIVFKFGKYKGITIREIAESQDKEKINYKNWLLGNTDSKPSGAIKEYAEKIIFYVQETENGEVA